jgi:hypothetical protein
MAGKLLVLGGTILSVLLYLWGARRASARVNSLILNLFSAYALIWVGFTVYLWFNHINFPLNLEAMELLILQHLRRLMSGLPIYVAPAPDFVPLVYAPLYYYLSVPFAWLFGANLFTLRLVAILGMLGAGIVIFLAVRRHTASTWWAIMAVGLFAASYRAMDTYLDNAHSDSWLLFTVLLGCYLIDLNRSRATNLLGVFVLVVSFWFKQHGALFAVGGVLYLTWREGIKHSWMYWALATLFGPLLYALAPALMFGAHFHYYTLIVPSQWSAVNFAGFKRYLGYAIKNYLVLAASGTTAVFTLLLRFPRLKRVNIWYFTFPFAVLSGFLGAMDDGSNNNIFIPIATWFILTGVFGLQYAAENIPLVKTWALHLLAVGASFALLFYNPASVVVSRAAPQAYRDFIQYLNSLDGRVYAPWIGPLQDGYEFYPAVHWVPMEDLIRGPGVDEYNHPTTRKLLDPVLHPNGAAYILMNYPLEDDVLLSFLLEDYQLKEDLGERFAPLSTLPKRFNLQYPRYLYEYVPPR